MAAHHRRLAIALLAVAGALVLAAVGGSWLLVRIWGPSLAANRIAASIGEATGRLTHVERVVLEPLRGRVQILGLAIGGEPDPLLQVARIDVGVRLDSLWRLELVVGAAADGATATLRPEPGAGPRTAFEMPEHFHLGPITVRLASIRISRGRLRFEDPATDVALGLDGLAAEGRPDRGGLEIIARADTLDLRVGRFAQSLDRLVAEARIDATRVAVRRLAVDDARHRIAATGTIESPWSAAPSVTADVSARLSLAPLAKALDADAPVDGTAEIDVALGGALGAPGITGRLRAPRVDVAGVEGRDLSATLRLDADALTVADVAGRMLGGRVEGSVTMPVRRPTDTLVRFRLDGAEAAAVARLRGGALDIAGRVTLDGEARGDLSQPRSLSGSLDAEAADLSLPGALARLGAGRVRAALRMDAGRIVSSAEGRWPSASVSASARIEPDDRVRLDARAAADLSSLPGWRAGDSVDLAARGEGQWPRVALTAQADLARAAPAAGGGPARDAGRVDLRLDPVTGSPPRWSGAVRSRRLSLPWCEIADAHGTLAASTDSLELSRLVARVAGIPVEVSGHWARGGTGDVRLVAGPAALARLPGVPPALELDGVARAEVDVRVSGTGLDGTARVVAERVSLAGVALGRGTGEATVHGRTLRAALAFPERRLDMSALGDLLPGRALSAHIALRSFDLAQLTTAPPPVLRGTISASADLAVPVDTPREVRGTLTIQPPALAVAGTSWSSSAPIVVRVDGRRAVLEPLRLAGPAGTLTASGVAWDATAPSHVSLDLDARLAGLLPALGVGGRARARAQLSGDAGAIAGARAEARIDADGITLPGALARLGAGTGRADLRLADGVASLARGDVAFPGLTVAAGGRIHLDGRVALDAQATARAEPLAAALGLSDAAGTATATATVTGSLRQLDGRARLTSDRVSVAGLAMERIDGAARLEQGTLRLTSLTARLLGAALHASGEWTPSGAGRAELETGLLALEQLAAVPERLALRGALSLKAEATITRGRLTARGSAQLRDGRAAGLALGAGRLVAQLDDRQLHATLDLAQRRITGTARGRLEPGGALDATLDVSTLELQSVLHHLTGRSDLEASVAGRLTARLPWDRPSAVVAQVRLDPVALSLPEANVHGTGHVVASWDGGTFTLARAELTGAAGAALASGTLRPDGSLDAQVEARVPLAALLAPVDAVSGAEGTVFVQGHATGTLAAPVYRGEGTLTGGRLALRMLSAPLRDIAARVVATPGSVRLAEATAALGSGRLQATGEAAIAGRALGIYRVRLTGRDVPLRPLEGLDTLWNADLELTADGQGRALLSGDARLVRGTYSRDLVTLSALTSPQRAGPAEGPGLPLSIRASLDDNLLVRTSMARMRVGGTLNIRGTTAAPILLGTLEARDGTLVLRGQRYQLERAVVRFADPRRIEPLLDVTATTRIHDYDVTMRALGPVRNLDLRLSSSPSLPRDQLLSLVAYGKTGRETGEGAGGVVAGEAATLVVRELLNLSGGGEGEGLPAPLRAIMDSARVSYTHNSEDIGRFGIRVEYEVTGPFLLAGERTSQGYYVIDGIVRLRFR